MARVRIPSFDGQLSRVEQIPLHLNPDLGRKIQQRAGVDSESVTIVASADLCADLPADV